MGYMRSADGHRLDVLHPPRDLPGLVGWWDASDLTAADGAAIQLWRDKSGNGQDLPQATASLAPTAGTSGGKRHLHFGATSFLYNANFGHGGGGGGWQQPAAYAQPVTIIAVARIASAVSLVTRYLVGAGGSGTFRWLPANTSDAMGLNAGAVGGVGGAPVNDDTWHVLGTIASVGPSQFVDGTLVKANNTQDHSTGSLVGLAVGANYDGTLPMQNCDLRELIICNAALTLAQMDLVTAYLGAKW